jgi:hypothetical protein
LNLLRSFVLIPEQLTESMMTGGVLRVCARLLTYAKAQPETGLINFDQHSEFSTTKIVIRRGLVPDFCSIAAEDPGSNDTARGIEGHAISQYDRAN